MAKHGTTDSAEPDEAFPYKPPSDEVKNKYANIFELQGPLKSRFLKTVFDKVVSALLLIVASPVLLVLKIA